MAAERIKWLDAAKGIGIIFVVLGHTSIPEPLANYIWSFHIPLFFLLSGYLFGMRKPARFKPHLVGKVRTLLIPYTAFFIMLYVYYFALGSRYGEASSMGLTMPLKGFFYSSGNLLDGFFTPLWFLTCLFTVEVMFFWIYRLFTKWYGIALVACSVLGYLGSIYLTPHFRLPWGLDTAFTAVVFYGAGCALYGQPLPRKNASWAIIPIPVFLVVNFFVSRANGGATLRGNGYGNYFLFYIAAFAGVFAYILIARLLQKFEPLVFLGKNSLIIFGLHGLPFVVLKGFLRIVLKYPAANLQGSLLWGIIFTIACIFVLVPVIYLLNKYFSFMLGKSRLAIPRSQ